LATDIDTTHISYSTSKEKEEAQREGYGEDVDLPPGSFGLPFAGEGFKIIGSEGYEFFRNKCVKAGEKEKLPYSWAPIVKTHLFGERAICICGVEEAKLFYDTSKVTRAGSLTQHLRKYFFGEDTLINFDGEEHRYRKRKVLEFFTPEALQRHMNYYGQLLEKYMNEWLTQKKKICLQEEMVNLHTEFGIGAYLGIFDLPREQIAKRAKQLVQILEALGSVPLPVEVPGTRTAKAGKARRKLLDWMSVLIGETKEKLNNGGKPDDSFLSKSVFMKDLQGNPISDEVFASELINLLRPTTLAAYFQVFLMHAMHENKNILESIRIEVTQRLSDRDDKDLPYFSSTAFLNSLKYVECCVQEVRRFYPCIPLIVGRVKEAFEYNGIFFPKDYLLFLGVHAIHRDPRVWSNPDEYDPSRFADFRKENCKFDERFAVVQQGGGDIVENHRCAGEKLATYMVQSFASRMAVDYYWEFAKDQEFSYSTRVMPTLPKDGILLENFTVAQRQA